MMIYLNKLLLTVRFPFERDHRDVKHTLEMYFTYSRLLERACKVIADDGIAKT
jgi:hypothetical protein